VLFSWVSCQKNQTSTQEKEKKNTENTCELRSLLLLRELSPNQPQPLPSSCRDPLLLSSSGNPPPPAETNQQLSVLCGGGGGGEMGQALRRLFDAFFSTREMRVVMLGLDAAGKTTILYRLHMGEVLSTVPTVGFNVEKVQYKNVVFTVWDVGGQEKLRPLWKMYLSNSDALIYVVDSLDRERIIDARQEFQVRIILSLSL
jgi:hypothetical protein